MGVSAVPGEVTRIGSIYSASAASTSAWNDGYVEYALFSTVPSDWHPRAAKANDTATRAAILGPTRAVHARPTQQRALPCFGRTGIETWGSCAHFCLALLPTRPGQVAEAVYRLRYQADPRPTG